MSVKEMDTLHDSSCETDQKLGLNISRCEPTSFKSSTHTVILLEVLQSLRKDDILCDVRLEADDGTIVNCHKVVLVAASPYFSAMFCNKFKEHDKELVKIRELDSNVLQLLVDFIYTGEIMITEENVQDLLPAANILQLDYVVGVCTEYLLTQMDVSNCLGIKAFGDLHNCTELMKCSEEYIKKHFLDVVKGDEFLSVSSQQVIKLISCNDIDIDVPGEEKVFECVINWVKFDLDQRTDSMPELMENIRFPLIATTPEIFKKILEEPLIKNCPTFNDYVYEAFQFNQLKSSQYFTIPLTTRCKPRQSLQKVILIFNFSVTLPKCYTEWYEPGTKLRKKAPGINDCRKEAGLGVIKDQFVFAVGGVNMSSSQSVYMIDLSSPSLCWVPMVDMLVNQRLLGVGVIDDCLYAVGGKDGSIFLNSAEVFDVSIQKWRMISSMSIARRSFGVEVVNSRLYAVGGYDGRINLKSVECYDPTLDTWTFIENMSISRSGLGVGVLNGIMYAVGGYNGSHLKSVEAYSPSTGVWSTIADMHLCRALSGVVAFNGLLYVIGGTDGSSNLDSIEIYNPITNVWVMKEFSRNCYGGVVVNKPFHLCL